MAVILDKKQEQLVRGLVNSGRYPSDEAVLQRSLELLLEYESRLAELRAEIQKGIDSGEATPLDMEEIKAKARSLFGSKS